MAAILIALVTISISNCSSTRECAIQDDGTAPCGVLLGITTQDPTAAGLAAAEEFVGRPFDLVYRFHEIDDVIPTDDERKLVESGRALHLSIDTRVKNSREDLSWVRVSDGLYDDALTSTAKRLAALRQPIFVTYEHEMDQEFKRTLGTPSEFVAAWRHIYSLFRAVGARNVVWVWVATGTAETIARASEMWPGNDVVDWISWDVYNASGCRVHRTEAARISAFSTQLDVFYRWLKWEAPKLGIDSNKPYMISEMGSVVYPEDVALTARWYAQVVSVLKERPEIRAITLWDHTGNQACDYRFTGTRQLKEPFRRMVQAPLFAELTLNE